MSDIQRVEYDRIAYEAYCSVADEKTRASLPTWEEIKAFSPQAAKGWRAAANAVVAETIDWYREFLAAQSKHIRSL